MIAPKRETTLDCVFNFNLRHYETVGQGRRSGRPQAPPPPLELHSGRYVPCDRGKVCNNSVCNRGYSSDAQRANDERGRGFYPFTSQLNLRNVHGIGGARRVCVARVKGLLGGVRGA